MTDKQFLEEVKASNELIALGFRREKCHNCTGSGGYELTLSDGRKEICGVCQLCDGKGWIWKEPVNPPVSHDITETPTNDIKELIEASDKLAVAASEFLRDWTKGEFGLPPLAEYDAKAIRSACLMLDMVLSRLQRRDGQKPEAPDSEINLA